MKKIIRGESDRTSSFAIDAVKTVAPSREAGGNFLAEPIHARRISILRYRVALVIPLRCPFHRLRRNWINLKITRKDDRPVANWETGRRIE